MAGVMRIVVTGADGQVGYALTSQPRVDGVEIVGLNRRSADVCDASSMQGKLNRLRPNILVNCAAYTAVDRAETDQAAAFSVNVKGPAILAQWCARNEAVLIHLSTDYVFSGAEGQAWSEDDPFTPINIYGRSKAEGEDAVRAAGARHVILRTSWVYAAWGHNFVRTILRLASEREEISVVDDQWGRPTAASDIADAIIRVANRIRGPSPAFGTFHFANSGATTWRRFAEAILDRATDILPRRPRIMPIASTDYPTPARRPLNSVLDTRRYENTFGAIPRPWQSALSEVVAQLSDQFATLRPGKGL